MGARKHLMAQAIKENKAQQSFAILRNCPISPRKMRLVADMVRGKDVNQALDMLHYSSKFASKYLEKLVKSAIANWKEKNQDARLEESDLYISEIYVDAGRVLKRIQPAPQGRAHRVRKRSNHVTVVLDSYVNIDFEEKDEKETDI